MEGGVEWLFLTSSLTPTYTIEHLVLQEVNQDNVNVEVVNRRNGLVQPDYNSGFSIFMRYRNCSDNDLLFQYSYLRNNGTGSLKRVDSREASVFTNANGENAIQSVTQDDKGHLHSHMHIFDLLVGRSLPMNYQMSARLSGGLSFHDFYLFYQKSDNDLSTATATGVNLLEVENVFFKENYRFWGLGPKAQLALEYLMLPSDWNHSLNLNFNLQYALLFSKHWSNGKLRQLDQESDFANPDNQFFDFEDYRFYSSPDHRLLQNVNLDFGMNYRWESSYANLIFNLAAGYRVYTFWNMYNLFTSQAIVADGDDDSFATAFIRDDTMIFAGPYIRFTLAY